MATNKTYWLGEKLGSRRVGRVRIGRKRYAIGEEIPIDKVDPKKAKWWKGAGMIGSAPIQVQSNVEKNLLKEARDKVETLEKMVASVEDRERQALSAYNGLKRKVLGLDSTAQTVVALKAEVSGND